MTKETPEVITECWQLLVEYIPRREHSSAAEQLLSYLETVLDRHELQAVTDLDSDLAEAHSIMVEEDEINASFYDDDSSDED